MVDSNIMAASVAAVAINAQRRVFRAGGDRRRMTTLTRSFASAR